MIDKDKREWQRIAVTISAKCRDIDGAPRYEPVEVRDVHQEGCCFQGQILYSKGQHVRLVLELPFEGLVNIDGDVAWSGPVDEKGDFRTGVRFLRDNAAAEDTSMKLYHFCLLRQPK